MSESELARIKYWVAQNRRVMRAMRNGLLFAFCTRCKAMGLEYRENTSPVGVYCMVCGERVAWSPYSVLQRGGAAT